MQLRANWSFCPKCGADNRLPATRVTILDCEHDFVDGEFCVQCGVSVIDLNEDEDPETNWRDAFAWGMLIVGALMVAASEYIVRSAGSQRPLPGGSYLLARYGFYVFAAGIVLVVIGAILVSWK